MASHSLRLLPAALAVLCLPSLAQQEYEVRILGQVEFNSVSSAPLSGLAPGDPAELSFRLREDIFVNSPLFPTRGYRIDPSSWSFAVPAGSIPLQSPYSAPDLLFVIRDNDPAVDGFFVSSNVNIPDGVPLGAQGVFGPFENSFSVTYGDDLLPTLDIADAVGDYDFTGLTVFNWTIDDGPFNPIGLIFESLQVVPVVDASITPFGCGINPPGSLVPLGGTPTIGDTLVLGLSNPLGSQQPGSLGVLFLSTGASPLFPCGLPVPGLGMAGPGAVGELLLDLGSPTSSFPAVQPWPGPGGFADVPLPIPDSAAFAGVTLYFQGALIDPLTALIGLTEGIQLDIGN